MSLPAVDVNFLLRVAGRMQERRLHVYVPGAHRSAIAIVLRFGETEQQRTAHRLLACRDAGLSPVQLLQPLAASATAAVPSSLRMLFVRRADLAADRWSGSVTFPGGRRDAGDANDLRALEREVDQMLGIPLQSKEFVLLGRLRDYPIRSRHIQSMGTVQSRFVFLHTGEMTPTTHFSHHEVDAVQWVPLSAFTAEHVDRGTSVCHPIGCFVHATNADSRLLLTEAFSHAYLSFPSVRLPGQWRLWGLALRSASELVSLDDRASIDWPLVSSNNLCLQHLVIDAFHGYYEVLYAYYRMRARLRCSDTAALTKYMILPPTADAIMWGVSEHLTPRHVLFLLVDMTLLLFIVYCVAGVLFTASIACQTVFGWIDADGDKERLRAYYAANTPSLLESTQSPPSPHGDKAAMGQEPAPPFAEGMSPSFSSTSSFHPAAKNPEAAERAAADSEKEEAPSAVPDTTASGEKTGSSSGNEPRLPRLLLNTEDWEALRATARKWSSETSSSTTINTTATDAEAAAHESLLREERTQDEGV